MSHTECESSFYLSFGIVLFDYSEKLITRQDIVSFDYGEKLITGQDIVSFDYCGK